MIDFAISGENTTGAFCVFTCRAPSRRSVRCAAIRPISSGVLQLPHRPRARVPVVPLHLALLVMRNRRAEKPQYDRRYSPANPREFTRILCDVAVSKSPPPEFWMRVSYAIAAASHRRAISIRSAGGISFTSSK